MTRSRVEKLVAILGDPAVRAVSRLSVFMRAEATPRLLRENTLEDAVPTVAVIIQSRCRRPRRLRSPAIFRPGMRRRSTRRSRAM